MYDPEDTGYVDIDILRGIFEKLGFGALTEEDVSILVEVRLWRRGGDGGSGGSSGAGSG